MPWVKVFKRSRACNFELVMNFGRFGQTTVDNSLWIVYETFRLVHIYGVLWSQCDVPSHHHVLYTWCWKGILVHDARITNGTLNLICCMIISYFKPNWRCIVKNHMACDCAHPLSQIWGHLNNARWINGQQVANCVWETWSTHIVSQLW